MSLSVNNVHKGFFYIILDESSKIKGYLSASIHVLDEEYNPGKEVRRAFSQSRSLVVEIDLLRKVIGEWQLNRPEFKQKDYTTLEGRLFSGIDLKMIMKSRKRHLPLVELESLEMQEALKKKYPLDPLAMNQSMIDGSLDNFIGAFKAGSAEDLEKFMGLQGQAKEEFIYERNYGMAKKINKLLLMDSVPFVLVGFWHLILGKGSIPELLREKGWRVIEFKTHTPHTKKKRITLNIE